MNHAEALKATVLPNRVGVTGSNLGPRVKVTVTKQGANESELLAGSTEQGVAPVKLVLRTDHDVISIFCDDSKGLVAAGILGEHMRGQCPGSGPLKMIKDGGKFAFSFALPAKAEPPPMPTVAANLAASKSSKSQATEA